LPWHDSGTAVGRGSAAVD